MRSSTTMAELEEDNLFLSERDFMFLKDIVHQKTGISIDQTKKYLLQGRLSSRLKELGIDNIKGYLTWLRSNPETELEHLANAITTNTTSFFRHDYQFDFLAKYLKIKEKIIKANGLRIWSAGCSSGQEPYSIAWTVMHNLKPESISKVRIFATDIDSNVLGKAATGVYPTEHLKELPERYIKSGFLRGTGDHFGYAKVKPQIRALVEFRRVNLIEKWPFKSFFDIIFCRNVCIYFDKKTQSDLFERFAAIQKEGGYLLTGHAESIPDSCNKYKTINKSIYKKIC